MHYLIVAAAKDIRRRLADPAALVFWVGLPLLLGGLLSFISDDDSGAAPRATVLVVDEDATFVSGLLSLALARAAPLDLQPVARDEGRRRIDDGDATALLIVPAGFQQAVLDGASTAELTLVTNPAQQVLPGVVEESLEIAVEGVFYAQQIFGPTLRTIAAGGAGAGPPSNADVARLGVELNQQLARLRNVVIPPAIALTVVRAADDESGASLSLGRLLLPGMLFMSFLFIAGAMAGDVWEEQQAGTLRRSLTTPQSAGALLGGKLVAGAAFMVVIGFVALTAATFVYDIAWWRVPGALAWCVFTGCALLALFTPLQMVASTQRTADMVSSTILFPLLMLGGSFVPFETMPAWMAAVGQWTPNGLGVARLKDLLYGDPAPLPLAVAAVGIGLPAAAAFLLAARGLRRKFAVL